MIKTESSIQKYECGSTEVPFSALEKIAKALDITILFLLDDEYLESAAVYFKENGDNKTSSLFHDMAVLNKKLAIDVENNYTQILNNLFSMLNDSGKKKALERIEELLEIPRYTNPDYYEDTSPQNFGGLNNETL
nr:helix-turn-helix transcriptional regulator [uncultured Acetatifactor sp.]